MHKIPLFLLNVSLLLPAVALAAPAPAAKIHGWQAPDPTTQARADTTPLPAGSGALFLPRMTRDREPLVEVRQGRKIRAVGRPGRRIVLPPGRYDVVVGPVASRAGRVRQAVTIAADTTTVLRPAWGALQIDVVDGGGTPTAHGYELYDLELRRSVGLGFGMGKGRPRLKTWLLRPGVYRIVPPGASIDESEEVASVTVVRGGLVRFKLTTQTDGRFAGSTAMTRSEAQRMDSSKGPWTRRLVIGVDGTLTYSREVVGIPDQMLIAANAFVVGRLAYRQGWHALSLSLEAEGGVAFVDPAGDALPLIKSKDRARVSASYGLLLGSWIGPYARGFAETRLFDTQALFSEARTLRLRNRDGSTRVVNVPVNGTFRQTRAFAPTTLQGGAGGALNLLNRGGIWMAARVGLATRYNIFRDTFAKRDDGSTPEIEYTELDNFNQLGFEGTFDLDWRLAGWLSWVSSLEVFGEFEKLREPIIEWRNTLAFRINRYLSINYTLNLLKQPQIVDALQLQQYISLRAAFELL